ncbi:MAG: hypothetical protein ACK58N_01875 [Synechocystis sp.]
MSDDWQRQSDRQLLPILQSKTMIAIFNKDRITAIAIQDRNFSPGCDCHKR